jgi:hypothetical protein
MKTMRSLSPTERGQGGRSRRECRPRDGDDKHEMAPARHDVPPWRTLMSTLRLLDVRGYSRQRRRAWPPRHHPRPPRARTTPRTGIVAAPLAREPDVKGRMRVAALGRRAEMALSRLVIAALLGPAPAPKRPHEQRVPAKGRRSSTRRVVHLAGKPPAAYPNALPVQANAAARRRCLAGQLARRVLACLQGVTAHASPSRLSPYLGFSRRSSSMAQQRLRQRSPRCWG